MDNDIAVIDHDPTVAGVTLLFRLPFVLLAGIVNDRIRKRIQHAIAGACTNDEVISKRGNAF